MPEKIKVNVKLNGRPYALRVLPRYESLIRKAVDRLNGEIRQMKSRYHLPDETDVLALLLLSESTGKEICLHEREEFEKKLNARWAELDALLDRLEADIEQD